MDHGDVLNVEGDDRTEQNVLRVLEFEVDGDKSIKASANFKHWLSMPRSSPRPRRISPKIRASRPGRSIGRSSSSTA